MHGFGHQKDSPGNVPRKIASLMTSDRYTDQPLQWASSVVRSLGMSEGVLIRLLSSAPMLESATLQILGDSEVRDAGTALKRFGYNQVWRAALKACYYGFTLKSVREPSIGPTLFAATAAAVADTAAWIAERHIVDPNEAFSVSLWSDCGLVAAMYAFPDVYATAYSRAIPRPLTRLESDAFGFDHQLVGSCVMRLYKFPQPFIDHCGRHELDLLDLNLEEKLVRAARTAVESVGGWHHPKDKTPELSTGVLAAALLRETDREALADFARTSLGSSMRLLMSVQKKSA